MRALCIIAVILVLAALVIIAVIFGCWNNWSLSEKIAAFASVAGFLQFVALIVTVCVMRRSAERQLRAYCMVESIEITNVQVEKTPTAIITIKNSGQTPAKNVWHAARMGYDTYPMTRLVTPNFTKDKKITLPLAPQHSFLAECFLKEADNKHAVIKEQKFIDDLKGQPAPCALYVVGEIRYDDAFGKNRVTTYKLFTGGKMGFRHNLMATYEDGNDYT